MKPFKTIDDSTEIRAFQKWAQDNYVPHSPISGTWHPIVQAECVRINASTDVSLN